MWQAGNDVALAIGDQDRGRRRQSALLEMAGEPSQVEAGEDDAGNLIVAVVEALGEMDHLLASGRIDPIDSDGKSCLSHCPLEERLIGHRVVGCPSTRAKDTATSAL